MPRTAGFNSLDVGAFHDETIMTNLFLMFVGGGSAGTAGGIKITTFLVLVAIVLLIGYGRAQTGCVEGGQVCGSSVAGYVAGRVIFGVILGSIFFAIRMLWHKLMSSQRVNVQGFASDAKRIWTSRSFSEQQYN